MLVKYKVLIQDGGLETALPAKTLSADTMKVVRVALLMKALGADTRRVVRVCIACENPECGDNGGG